MEGNGGWGGTGGGGGGQSSEGLKLDWRDQVFKLSCYEAKDFINQRQDGLVQSSVCLDPSPSTVLVWCFRPLLTESSNELNGNLNYTIMSEPRIKGLFVPSLWFFFVPLAREFGLQHVLSCVPVWIVFRVWVLVGFMWDVCILVVLQGNLSVLDYWTLTERSFAFKTLYL